MNILTKETQQKLSSAQSVPTPDSIVKELIENSLDANATSITVTIKNGGLDGITVLDNGSGIDDLDLVCMRYTTSKISNFDDISTTEYYGFRGEALNSICSMAGGIVIATKREQDPLGIVCEYDVNGNVKSKSVKSMKNGTLIEIKDLFTHIPVRRQVFSKRTADICRKIKELILSYSLINFKVRFSLKVGNDPAFVKSTSIDLAASITLIFGSGIFKKLQLIQVEKLGYKIQCFVAKNEYKTDSSLWKSSSTLPKIYINKRPATIDKFLGKFIGELRSAMNPDTTHYPLMVMTFTLPTTDVDVNVEPDKSRMIFSNSELVKELLDEIISKASYSSDSSMLMENDTTIVNDPDQDIASLKNFELRRELLSDSEKENEPVECMQKNNCKKPKLDQLQDLLSQSDTRSQSGVTEISNTVPDYQKIDSTMEVDVIDWSRGKANGVNLIGHLLDNLENPVKMHRDTSPKKLVQSRIPENPFQSKFNKNIERNRPNDNIVLKKLVQPNTRVTKNRQERHGEYSVPSQFEDRSQPKINEIFKRKTTDFYSSYRSIKRNHPQKIDPYNSQQISNETYGKLIGTVEFRGKEQLSVLSINRELYLVSMERVKESFNSIEPSILENLNTNDTCPHGKHLMIKL